MTSTEIFQNGNPDRPWTIYDDIANACGKEVAILLHDEFAGIEIKIPESVDTKMGNMLSDALGKEAAKALCREFPGDKFHCLQLRTIQNRERNHRILQKLLEGECTSMEIARIEGVSTRHVNQIRRDYKDKHPEVFTQLKTRPKPPQPIQ